MNNILTKESKLDQLIRAIIETRAKDVENLLLQDKRLINSINGDGWTPIHICAAYGNKNIMKII